MSGLTKKTVIADQTLSTILGVKEGELVSYSELSKGLHKYIKDNDLRNLQRVQPSPAASQPSPVTTQPVAAVSAGMKKCRDCGADISAEAVFCDLCGVRQW